MSLNVDLYRLSRRMALAHRDRGTGNEAIAVEEVKKVPVLVGAHDTNDMHRPVQGQSAKVVAGGLGNVPLAVGIGSP